MTDFASYQSPYSWRYGSPEMRTIWSETNRRKLWRKIWLALAEIQAEYGLVTDQQLVELRSHLDDINIPRALEIESVIHHDVMAEVRTYAEQCPQAGKILHFGMTSMDVVDNADALRVKASLELIRQRLAAVMQIFCDLSEHWAGKPIIAYTHLQPAEPTTLGYRFAQYLQDLYMDWEELQKLISHQRAKGLKGAVGNRAAFGELFPAVDLESIETKFSSKLGIPFFPVATQVYPRKQDYQVLSVLAGTAASLNKFAFDLRFLQTPSIGEWMEPFQKEQVGSSAMPFKRNPVRAEKINSLARLAAQFPRVAWDDAAFSLLERTLDDSANRRTILPEAFLNLDEILITTSAISSKLAIDPDAAQRNLDTYLNFAAQEKLLMALTKAGADRQEMHELLRVHALRAYDSIRQGSSNPLRHNLIEDSRLRIYLTNERISEILEDTAGHTGDAEKMAKSLAADVRAALEAGIQ
jgi:adenylosuccinate lyase